MDHSGSAQVPNYISLKVCRELYALVAKDADREEKNLIDIVVQVLAKHYGRPDLGVVPRKRSGRPRKPPTVKAPRTPAKLGRPRSTVGV